MNQFPTFRSSACGAMLIFALGAAFLRANDAAGRGTSVSPANERLSDPSPLLTPLPGPDSRQPLPKSGAYCVRWDDVPGNTGSLKNSHSFSPR